MKKLIVLSGIVASAYGVLAQGTVSFVNTSSPTTKISVNSAPGGPATGLAPAIAGGFYYELFYSASGATAVGGASGALIPGATSLPEFVTSDSNWADTTLIAPSIATAGRLTGTLNATVNQINGTSSQSVIIGWSANIGTTVSALEAFLAAPAQFVNGTQTFVGESEVGTIAYGSTSGVPPAGNALSATLPGFVLGEVAATPEPTTIALGVMGGLSLLALRRKKA